MRILSTLSLSWLALALCGGAVAASSDVQVSADGTTATFVGTAPAALSTVTRAQPLASKLIYSNFSSSGTLFDAYSGWVVSGRQSSVERVVSQAMAFSAAKASTLKSVSLALSHFTGTNEYKISINADIDGVPGPILKQLAVTELPSFGSCCVIASTGFGGLALEADQTYWLVARVPKPQLADSFGVWNFNNTGATGLMALRSDGGWSRFESTLGAFEVLGK